MTTRWDGPAQRQDTGDAAERARVREAQHALLADLLGAYADGELPAESAARIEAHLVGCTRCRRDLATQVALRDRLAAEVVLPAPPSLRDRIIAATAAVAPALDVQQMQGPPAVAAAFAMPVAHVPARAWSASVWRARVVVAAVALALLAGVGGVQRWRERPGARPAAMVFASSPTPAREIPILAAALADFRRSTAGELPGRARDLDAVRAAVGFPVEPLRAPGLRLLAAWTTTLDGEPTAVLAYRRDDRLVLQYLVPEWLFFRHVALRAATAAHRPLAATDGAQTVLAWPEATAGSLLVSDDNPEQLANSLPTLSFSAPLVRPVPDRRGEGP